MNADWHGLFKCQTRIAIPCRQRAISNPVSKLAELQTHFLAARSLPERPFIPFFAIVYLSQLTNQD